MVLQRWPPAANWQAPAAPPAARCFAKSYAGPNSGESGHDEWKEYEYPGCWTCLVSLSMARPDRSLVIAAALTSARPDRAGAHLTTPRLKKRTTLPPHRSGSVRLARKEECPL